MKDIHRLTVRIKKSHYDQLKRIADDMGNPVSSVLRDAVVEFLSGRG